MYIYFKDCSVSKSHKLRDVIERHFLSLEFPDELKEPDAEKFQEKFLNYIGIIEEHSNSECIEKQLGKRMFTIVHKRF